MSFYITSDFGEVEAAVDHLLAEPVGGAAERLDAVLHEAFLDTQAVVHVISGHLKASGREHSVTAGGEWRGEITYDAARYSRKDGSVIYAYYEQRRGGEHDFMRNVPRILDRMGRAILDSL